MSYASNLPPGAQFGDCPWDSGDRPGSLVERSERIDGPMVYPEPSAANLAWRARLEAGRRMR